MASFDVKSLFTNIPLNFTLKLLLDSIFSGEVNKFHGLNCSRLKKLLHWICKTSTFQFDGKFYKQTDGIAMGSPIAPLLADVLMNHILNEALQKTPLEDKPTFMCRYVDDIFVATPDNNKLDAFLKTLCNIHSSITFTKDLSLIHI